MHPCECTATSSISNETSTSIMGSPVDDDIPTGIPATFDRELTVTDAR